MLGEVLCSVSVVIFLCTMFYSFIPVLVNSITTMRVVALKNKTNAKNQLKYEVETM
jgi:hypothetical protein